MDYPQFMNYACTYLTENADYSICRKCGGTGLDPIMCCSGDMCGCYGLPIDFREKCSKCERIFDMNNIKF